jgi:alkylation response protein AidB-like acyl-CoA dehydrogenase
MAPERLYRHIRAFRIFDGTSEIQRLIITRDALRRAASQAVGDAQSVESS